ncbi:MAG: YfcC family protein [Gemmatimonadota bacterium]
MMRVANRPMAGFSFPTPYTILILVIALAAFATWLLPAGTYDTLSYNADRSKLILTAAEGERELEPRQRTLDSLQIRVALEKFTNGDIRRPVAVPGSYRRVEAEPQGIMAVIKAPIRGVYEAIDVILFVLVIGGFIEVFSRSGAFAAGIQSLSTRLKGRESWLVIILTALFALGGTTYGMGEECIAFYPVLVPIFLAAGYDLLVPLAVIFGGAAIGFMASTINPFATIIASDAAGISWTVGLWGRVLMWVIGTAMLAAYIIRYGRRVQVDRSRSLSAETAPAFVPQMSDVPAALDGKARLLLIMFGVTFVAMVIGVSRLGWWFPEMTALFLVAAVLVGLVRGGGEKKFTTEFVQGAAGLLGVALIIGIARGVTLVMDDGQISGTLLYYSARAVEDMPKSIFIVALMLVFAGLTLFISSASGLAVVTMPIMAPLATVVGVPTEQIVNAYLYGLGLMSFITPTGLILPSLAMVGVSYAAWLRFILPFLGLMGMVAALFLIVGVLI